MALGEELLKAACSSCGMQVLTNFERNPGKPIYCPECLLQQLDISKSDYVIDFVAFLVTKLGKSTIVTAVKVDEECNVLLTPKGEKPKLGCRIQWRPKYSDRLVPPTAIFEMSTKDKNIAAFIEEFIKKNGIEGQWL